MSLLVPDIDVQLRPVAPTTPLGPNHRAAVKRYVHAVASLNRAIADVNSRVLLARLDTAELTAGAVQQILQDGFVCPITRIPLDATLLLNEDLAELGRFYAAVTTLKDTLCSMDFQAPQQRPVEESQ
jgi:hypothetical protein